MADWTDWLNLGANLLSYKTAADSARQQAQAQQQVAQQAASMAEFKPYSITSGFGIGYYDEKARRAGYTLDPVLEAYRNKLYSLGAGAMGQVELDPTKAAAQYMAEQQGLLAPTRQAEDIAARQRALQSGRIGLGVSGEALGAGAGTGMLNPEQYAMNLARARADAEMAAGARQQAIAEMDKQIARGQGLFQTGFGTEELGMKPLAMGAEFGGRAMSPAAAQALLQGGLASSSTLGQLGQAQSAAYQQFARSLGGMFSTPQSMDRSGFPGYR